MTIEQRMNANLQDHGMHPREEREAVIALARDDPIGLCFDWRCESAEDDFSPESNTSPLWKAVKRIARGYLAEHNPGATYRSFFDE